VKTILLLSGSLRHASSNTSLLRAVAKVGPKPWSFDLFDGLDELPHFNPDLDVDPLPPAVSRLRVAVARADALVISSPEYAHGVPGVLKNALDWLVSFEAFSGKRVVLMNGGTYVQAQLLEILTTMSADVMIGASLLSIHLRQGVNEFGEVSDPAILSAIHECLSKLG